MDMEKRLFRVTEAAELLRVSRWTIYRWVEEGRLKGTKLGRGSLRIFGESVMKLVEEHRTDDGAVTAPPVFATWTWDGRTEWKGAGCPRRCSCCNRRQASVDKFQA